jgi:hypothetical protein
MSDNQQRKQGAAQKPETERKPNQAPAQPSNPKPEAQEKKPGPSVDIGPGPGADVVATPPRRI